MKSVSKWTHIYFQACKETYINRRMHISHEEKRVMRFNIQLLNVGRNMDELHVCHNAI